MSGWPCSYNIISYYHVYLCAWFDVCFSRSDRFAPSRKLDRPERHQRGRRRVLWLSRESQPTVDEAHLVSQRKCIYLVYTYIYNCVCRCVCVCVCVCCAHIYAYCIYICVIYIASYTRVLCWIEYRTNVSIVNHTYRRVYTVTGRGEQNKKNGGGGVIVRVAFEINLRFSGVGAKIGGRTYI